MPRNPRRQRANNPPSSSGDIPERPKLLDWRRASSHLLLFSVVALAFWFFSYILVATGTDALLEVFGLFSMSNLPPFLYAEIALLALLSLPLALLMTHTLFYLGRNIRIRGERTYGPYIWAAVSGILALLVATNHWIDHRSLLNLSDDIALLTFSGAIAGLILLLLNVMGSVLRLVFGNEMIFRNDSRKDPDQS